MGEFSSVTSLRMRLYETALFSNTAFPSDVMAVGVANFTMSENLSS